MAHWHVLERRVVTEAILAGRTPPAGPSVAAAGETEATGAASAAGAMLAECCRRSLARLLLYLIRRRLTRGEDAAEPRVRTPLHGHGGSHTNRTERENIARARLIWIRRRRSGASQTRRRAASEPVFSAAHGLFCVLLLPALRLAPAARAHQLALLRCSPTGRCAVGGERRPVAAGASRRGWQPPEGAGARGGAGRRCRPRRARSRSARTCRRRRPIPASSSSGPPPRTPPPSVPVTSRFLPFFHRKSNCSGTRLRGFSSPIELIRTTFQAMWNRTSSSCRRPGSRRGWPTSCPGTTASPSAPSRGWR